MREIEIPMAAVEVHGRCTSGLCSGMLKATGVVQPAFGLAKHEHACNVCSRTCYTEKIYPYIKYLTIEAPSTVPKGSKR